MSTLGRSLIVLGVLLVVMGAAVTFLGRLGLPGDFVIRRGSVTLYLPLAASLILSVLLTIALNLVFRQR